MHQIIIRKNLYEKIKIYCEEYELNLWFDYFNKYYHSIHTHWTQESRSQNWRTYNYVERNWKHFKSFVGVKEQLKDWIV